MLEKYKQKWENHGPGLTFTEFHLDKRVVRQIASDQKFET